MIRLGVRKKKSAPEPGIGCIRTFTCPEDMLSLVNTVDNIQRIQTSSPVEVAERFCI